MTLFNIDFTIVQLSLILFITIYGVSYGIKNNLMRIWSLISNQTMLQSPAGRILDFTWIATIITLIGTYY